MIFLIIGIYWLFPFITLILGLSRLKTRPKNAKNLLIVTGILLLVGLGSCGLILADLKTAAFH